MYTASIRLTGALFALILSAGCTTNSSSEILETPVLDDGLFGERPSLASDSEVHRLTDRQQQDFFDYFLAPDIADIPAHQRVFDYLDRLATRFSYQGNTYTASEALQHSSGNCLSLAILTTALARLADVEVSYQLTDSTPVFEMDSKLARRGLHVRTLLHDPTWVPPEGFLTVSPRGITVDYFPTDHDRFIGNIEAADYLAMYFRNLAADALATGDLRTAFWLTMKSLEIVPDDPDSLNTLAIIYDRAGDQAKSEEVYRFGLQNSRRQVSLLRNFSKFLRRQQRDEEAEEFERILDGLDDENPFDWLNAGRVALADGNHKQAIRYFRKSAEIAPYLHEVHFGLARAHYATGSMDEARQALALALEYSYKASTRDLYHAKLAALGGRPASD